MPSAEMQIDPQGRFATVRLAARSVQAIDVPAGDVLRVEELQ
jgi:hypothetical protein